MMITRCPACATMFNVVADQLKVSQGWVRCGQCSDVFDASMHLQDTNDTPSTDQDSSATPFSTVTHNGPTAPAESQPEESLPEEPDIDDDFERSLRAAVKASSAASASDFGPLSVPAKERYDQQSFAPSAVPAKSAVAASAFTATAAESPGRLLNDEIEAEESAAAADSVSFVQHARRQAFWKKLWVRLVLGAVAILLLMGLLLQIVLQQKDHLVLVEPRLKPVVQALCASLGCELNPLRKIDAVVIDSSTFTKLGVDSYKLSFSIKNLGAVSVAMPSLEVTLTDTQDQALLRRVLTPAQFGASAALLSAGTDFQGVVVLDVSAAALARSGAGNNARVAGYRLLAFYP